MSIVGILIVLVVAGVAVYLVKWATHRSAVASEWHHPVRSARSSCAGTW
jgi:tellurite resistance protein TehA-like permease